jgi:WhiB family redox-sensing transcriptional regulator
VNWQASAACRGKPPEWFMPERGDQLHDVREICAGCAVAGPCLDWALVHHEVGFWGGTSERERRRLRAELRRAS